MAKRESNWVKWLLAGCGGCLVLGILLGVFLYFAARSAFQQGGGALMYQESPAVDIADKVDHPENIEVFLDLKTAADAGIKAKKVTISEGEMNAYLASKIARPVRSKGVPGDFMKFLVDFGDNRADLYFSVKPGQLAKGLSWIRLSYLNTYGLVKDAPPITLDLQEVKQGSTEMPLSQWKSFRGQALQPYRQMESENPAISRMFEWLENGLVLSRDITDVVITDKELTYTLKPGRAGRTSSAPHGTP